MKTKVSPTIVGAFVIGAFALGFLALLAFGGVTFVPGQRFIVYFNEPAQGLDVGSSIRLRGVRVGHVVDLHVRYDTRSGESTVAVVGEINPNSLRDSQGNVINLADPELLKRLVAQGLQARLDVASLATGVLFVELDFRQPGEPPAQVSPGEGSSLPVVPSVPSTIAAYQASASQILGQLQKVDFEGLSTNLKALLVDVRHQIDGLDLAGLTTQWKQTGASVEAVARSPEIPQLLANLDGAVTDLRGALANLRTDLANLNQRVDANSKDLQASLDRVQDTLRDFDVAALAARRFIAAQQDLGANANQAMQSLASAADSVQRLADFLERNPNALLTGKKPPPSP